MFKFFSDLFKGFSNFLSSVADSGLFQFTRFATSAIWGIPTALVGTALAGTVFVGLWAGNIASTKIYHDYFGEIFRDEFSVKNQLEKVGNFMREIWPAFGIYAGLVVAKYFDEKAREKQESLGYGTSAGLEETGPEVKQGVLENDKFEESIKREVEKATKFLNTKRKREGEEYDASKKRRVEDENNRVKGRDNIEVEDENNIAEGGDNVDDVEDENNRGEDNVDDKKIFSKKYKTGSTPIKPVTIQLDDGDRNRNRVAPSSPSGKPSAPLSGKSVGSHAHNATPPLRVIF